MAEAAESTLKFWAWDRLKTRPTDSSRVFSVLQWNTLNSELSDRLTFPKIDEKFSCWPYRQELIKKYLLTIPADFYCLEEINTKTLESYTKVFESINLKVKFFVKSHELEGTLIAFNEEKWKSVEEFKYYYKEPENGEDMPNLVASVVFKNTKTDDFVQIAVTHLKSKHEFEETRYVQVQQLIEVLNKTKREFEEKHKTGFKTVLVGDFNAEPDWKSMRYVAENSGLASAFSDAPLTTFKIREKEYCRVIDYIFHDPDLKVIARNAIPTKEEFGEDGLPNECFPSDHFFLLAQFEY